MSRKRIQSSAESTSQVALGALSGVQTQVALAPKFEVHSTLMTALPKQ